MYLHFCWRFPRHLTFKNTGKILSCCQWSPPSTVKRIRRHRIYNSCNQRGKVITHELIMLCTYVRLNAKVSLNGYTPFVYQIYSPCGTRGCKLHQNVFSVSKHVVACWCMTSHIHTYNSKGMWEWITMDYYRMEYHYGVHMYICSNNEDYRLFVHTYHGNGTVTSV